MRRLIELLLFCLAITVAASTSTKTILEFLKEQDAVFQLDKPEKAVLIMGDTGTGKTTLTLLLTNNTVEAKKDSEGGSFHHIYDKNGKIGNVTGISHTFIPEAFIDEEYNTLFYDCPGFENSRSADHDITIGYLINKLLTHAQSFKIVVVVNYASVKRSGMTSIFPKFIKTFLKLFKNIDTYKDSIAIVATKVVKHVKKVGGIYEIINDASVVLEVASYLQELKDSTTQLLLQKNLSKDEQNFNSEKLKFLNILLEKNNKTEYGYDRIGILRTPSKNGSLFDDSLIQKETQKIKKIIRENLQYVGKNKSVEFGFTVSADSLVYVNDLITQLIINELFDDVSGMCEGVKQYYRRMLEDKKDILELNNALYDGQQVLKGLSSTDPLAFTEELIKRTRGMNTDSLVNKTLEHIEYIKFLLKIKFTDLSIPLKFQWEIEDVQSDIKLQYDAHLEEWVEDLLEVTMPTVFGTISTDINKFYTEVEKNATDIYLLREQLLIAHEDLSNVDVTKPVSLLNAINKLKIAIPVEDLGTLNDFIRKIEYVPGLVRKRMNTMELSAAEFTKIVQELEKTVTCYNHMISLDSHLPLTNLERTGKGTELIQTVIMACDNHKVDDLSLNTVILSATNYNDTSPSQQYMPLRQERNKFFESIQSAFTQKPNISCPIASKMTVTGTIISMSQITTDQTCFPKAKTIEIFASISMTFDSSIEITGNEVQMTITSPVWSVTGEQTIILRGNDGKSKEDAPDCTTFCSKEHFGEAGYPGETGGNFLGIGEVFLNGSSLTILSEGGKGGSGQNGGKGHRGINGSEPTIEGNLSDGIKACLAIFPFNILCIKNYCKSNNYRCEEEKDGFDLSLWKRGSCGTDGGPGGNGGVGGFGGKPGRIQIIELDKKSDLHTVTRVGNLGSAGKGGPGGDPAVKFFAKRIDFKWERHETYLDLSSFQRNDVLIDEMTESGPLGLDRFSTKNRRNQEPAHGFYNPSEAIKKFRDHMINSLESDDFRESKTKEFIFNTLDKDRNVEKLSSQE